MKTMIIAAAGVLALGALAACNEADVQAAEEVAEDAVEEVAAVGQAMGAGAVAGVNAAAERTREAYDEAKARTDAEIDMGDIDVETDGEPARTENDQFSENY